MSNITFLDIFKISLVVLSIIVAIIVLDDFIDNKIDNKISDSEYISSLSHRLRPFLIINNKNNVVYDHGAMSFIDSISIKTDLIEGFLESPIDIIIYPKEFLKFKPLVECLSPINYVEKFERYNYKSLKYTLNVSGHSGPLSEILFRIEIFN